MYEHFPHPLAISFISGIYGAVVTIQNGGHVHSSNVLLDSVMGHKGLVINYGNVGEGGGG